MSNVRFTLRIQPSKGCRLIFASYKRQAPRSPFECVDTQAKEIVLFSRDTPTRVVAMEGKAALGRRQFRSARKLHQSTSRFLSQVSFLVLGVVPLCICLVWSILQYVPFYQASQVRAWEKRLSVGRFKVKIERVQELRPGRVRLSGLRVLDRENNKSEFARVAQALLTQGISYHHVVLSEPEVDARYLNRQWAEVHEGLLCRPGDSASSIHVSAAKVALHTGQRQFQLNHFDARIHSKPNETDLHCEFGMHAEDQGCEITVRRMHIQGQESTYGAVSSKLPIPTEVVQHLWRPADRLGTKATMKGALQWHTSDRGWNVSIGARPVISGDDQPLGVHIEGIDFGTLTWNEPAELTGLGNLWIHEAALSSRGLERMRGIAHCENGRVSQSLLLQAENHLGLQVSDAVRRSPTQDIAFRVAAFSFDATPSQLTLAGLMNNGVMFADGAASDTVLSPLVAQPTRTQLVLSDLIPVLNARRMASPVEGAPAEASSVATDPEQHLPKALLAKSLLQWIPAEPKVNEPRVADDGSTGTPKNF